MHEQERTGAKQSGYHLDNKSVHKLTEENGSIGTNEHCTRTSVKCMNKKELEQRIMRNKNESVLEIISTTRAFTNLLKKMEVLELMSE